MRVLEYNTRFNFMQTAFRILIYIIFVLPALSRKIGRSTNWRNKAGPVQLKRSRTIGRY